jgi:hypothetical protein
MGAEEVLVAEATLAVAAVSAALLAAALALRQPFTVAAFEQRRLFEVRTLPAEVSPARLPRRTSTTVAEECQL